MPGTAEQLLVLLVQVWQECFRHISPWNHTKSADLLCQIIWQGCACSARSQQILLYAGLPCQYGELPGRWHVRRGDNFSSWHTLSDACPLADRVTEYGVALNGQIAPQPSAYQLNLLVFGDSIDRCVGYASRFMPALASRLILTSQLNPPPPPNLLPRTLNDGHAQDRATGSQVPAVRHV